MSPQEFDALLIGLRALRAADFAGGAAMATLVRTRGPVFRRAGARMLVFADGRIVRGLSAGCPEADIAGRAREVIASDEARLLVYDKQRGYDSLLELGCGGEMEVLLEPLRNRSDLIHAETIAACLRSRRPAWLATAFAASDGRCLPRPRRLLWDGQLRLDEWDDSDAVAKLFAGMGPPDSRALPRVVDVATREGSLQVLLEPLRPATALVLIGVNSTTVALARLGRGLGWSVQLIDHRDDNPSPDTPVGADLLCAAPSRLAEVAMLDPHTAVVVMTHNLGRDLEYLAVVRDHPLAYLGALGSRQRAAQMRDAIGTTATRLHVPAGLDMAAETPEEIALSIAGEIQAVIHGRDGRGLSHGDGPLH